MHKNMLALSLLSIALSASAAQAVPVDVSAIAFGSLFYGQSLKSGLLETGFTDTKANFTSFSLLGSDITAKLGDNFAVQTEIIANGSQNGATQTYDLYMQWGYISYTASEGSVIKLGRQRYPLWMSSEFINEHHELPFRVMPAIVYGIAPFSTFDGGSVGHSYDVAGGKFGFSIFGGQPVLDVANSTTFTANVQNLYGARIGFEGDGWRVRAIASSVSSNIGLTGVGNWAGHQQTYTAGYRYDKNNIVSWGEYAYATSSDGTQTFGGKYLGRVNSGYVLGGYRLGAFLPRYTFAQTDMKFGFQNGKTTSHILGLNYNVNEKVTLKGEYELDLVPNGQGNSLGVTRPTGGTETTGSAVFFGADFVI